MQAIDILGILFMLTAFAFTVRSLCKFKSAEDDMNKKLDYGMSVIIWLFILCGYH